MIIKFVSWLIVPFFSRVMLVIFSKKDFCKYYYGHI
jgi:hypothetical protein